MFCLGRLNINGNQKCMKNKLTENLIWFVLFIFCKASNMTPLT